SGFHGVSDVFLWCNPFKISNAVILRVAVFMIALVTLSLRRSLKGDQYKSMYLACCGCSRIAQQRDVRIFADAEKFTNATIDSATSLSIHRTFWSRHREASEASDSSDIRYFVAALKAFYRLPYFALEFCWSKFLNSHDLNLRHRLGLWLGSLGVL